MYNLTSWGYQDCFPEKNDGAYGGVLTRLLYRTLPEYYPARSSYARFPFMVPELMQGYLAKQAESPVKKYEFGKPTRPLKTVVVTGYESVKEVLVKKELFRSAAEEKLVALSGGAKPEIRPVSTYIFGLALIAKSDWACYIGQRYPQLLYLTGPLHLALLAHRTQAHR